MSDRIRFLSSGSFGLVFEQSGYAYKIVTLMDDKIVDPTCYQSYTLNNNYDSFELSMDTVENFKNEAILNIKISHKTRNTFGEPICPVCHDYVIYREPSFLDNWIRMPADMPTYIILTNLKSMMTSAHNDGHLISFGVIKMDYSSKVNMSAYIYESKTTKTTVEETQDEIDKLESMARIAVLNVAYNTGFSHADYHFGNFLVDPNSDYYGADIKGKVEIMDFGYSTEMDELRHKSLENIVKRLLNKINENSSLYNMKPYVNGILRIIYDVKRNDGDSLSKFPSYYEWFIGAAKLSIPPRSFDNSKTRLTDNEVYWFIKLFKASGIGTRRPTASGPSLPVKSITSVEHLIGKSLKTIMNMKVNIRRQKIGACKLISNKSKSRKSVAKGKGKSRKSVANRKN